MSMGYIGMRICAIEDFAIVVFIITVIIAGKIMGLGVSKKGMVVIITFL